MNPKPAPTRKFSKKISGISLTLGNINLDSLETKIFCDNHIHNLNKEDNEDLLCKRKRKALGLSGSEKEQIGERYSKNPFHEGKVSTFGKKNSLVKKQASSSNLDDEIQATDYTTLNYTHSE
jgi:hypothetical protein